MRAWKASAAHLEKQRDVAPPLLVNAGRDLFHHSPCRAALSNSTPLPTLRQGCRCVMLRPLPRGSFVGGWGVSYGSGSPERSTWMWVESMLGRSMLDETAPRWFVGFFAASSDVLLASGVGVRRGWRACGCSWLSPGRFASGWPFCSAFKRGPGAFGWFEKPGLPCKSRTLCARAQRGH